MPRLDIGIDAGGTRTRLQARTASGKTLTADGEGSNPRVIGTEGTIATFSSLIDEACGAVLVGADVFLCAGVAGASTPDVQEIISAGIRPSLSRATSSSIRVTDDATTSFEAAFAGEPGTLLLLGTGSNIISKTTMGDWIHSGGWGYLLGDEGSGYALGRIGMRAVARAIDRGLRTRLLARAAADLGLDSRDRLLAAVYGSTFRMSDFAQTVLDEAARGDIESRLLVSRAVSALIDDLASAVETYANVLPRTIRVIGGLSHSSLYMNELAHGVAIRLGDEWHIEPAARTPLDGALYLASKLPD